MKIIVRCLFLFLLFIITFFPNSTAGDIANSQLADISVELKGEVSQPGVYTVKAFSTVKELLDEVELSEDADLSGINLTGILRDHDVLVIPALTEEGVLVSINSGTAEQLMTVPGIGPVMAGRIIEWRQNEGSFQSIDDLIKVKGIGAKTLEKIRPYVSL